MGLYCFYNGSGDNGDAVTCSEAHGYAMLIAVLHGNQADFDGLLQFFLNFRNERGLMKWQVRMNSHSGQLYVAEDAEDCATDGDIDIATALFLAHRNWPHGSQMFPAGAYQYEAANLSDALLAHCIHPHLNVPLLGDWCNMDDKDNCRLYDSTRSSDFILSSFLLFHFKHPNPQSRARWQQVLESTLEVALSQLNINKSGLIADFLVYDKRHGWHPAKGKHLESKHDGDMSWNACRTPWRLAHYYAVTGDQRILPLLQAMMNTLSHCQFPSIPAGLRLRDGKGLVDYSSRAFIAPAGYLAYVLGNSQGHMAAVRALDDEEPEYFGDSIDLVIAEEAMAAPSWLS
ncbi:O-glycosyl hydrolase [Malassezia pachydermatis]